MDTDPIEHLFARLRAGETRAVARAVSLVEDGAPESAELLRLCGEAIRQGPRAFRAGITGPAGAGKSTLVDGLMKEFRRRGRRVGIVAVDPSSTFSGGAILGDRIRLGEADSAVYMRSMAARGHLGGLAAATEDVLTVIEASGKDLLLIETMGVGQGEIEVVELADAVAVVLTPGMGDDVQSLKAGVLEIASVFVLNKADRPGIEALQAEMEEMLSLSRGATPVLKTIATAGDGVAELAGVLESQEKAMSAHARRALAAKASAARHREGHWTAVQPALDHLGIAVRSIADASVLYEALGAACVGREEVPHERVRVAMFRAGDSRIELLEAIDAESPVARFLARRGEGLHHVALRVPDLAAAVEQLKGVGVRMISDKMQLGAGGHRYVFVHPSSANGVLLELVDGGETL